MYNLNAKNVMYTFKSWKAYVSGRCEISFLRIITLSFMSLFMYQVMIPFGTILLVHTIHSDPYF